MNKVSKDFNRSFRHHMIEVLVGSFFAVSFRACVQSAWVFAGLAIGSRGTFARWRHPDGPCRLSPMLHAVNRPASMSKPVARMMCDLPRGSNPYRVKSCRHHGWASMRPVCTRQLADEGIGLASSGDDSPVPASQYRVGIPFHHEILDIGAKIRSHLPRK